MVLHDSHQTLDSAHRDSNAVKDPLASPPPHS